MSIRTPGATGRRMARTGRLTLGWALWGRAGHGAGHAGEGAATPYPAALVAAVGAALLLAEPARAGDNIPFYLTNIKTLVNGFVRCDGPWFRASRCGSIHDVAPEGWFYAADDNFLSPYGQWSCSVYHDNSGNPRCDFRAFGAARVHFCLNNANPKVELTWDGQAELTVNQPATCGAARAAGVLGQNGEDDTSPAQDVDTFGFAGKPGEKVQVRLGRDGTSGSAGEVATLRVRTASGAVLGQRSGSVPLKLDLTLPGPVEVVVLRQPGGGEPLRGYYTLEIVPASGDIGDRQLRPTADVEH